MPSPAAKLADRQTRSCCGRLEGSPSSNLQLDLALTCGVLQPGRLLNVILFPLFTLFAFVLIKLHWKTVHPDFYQFVLTVWFMNAVLLFFNLIPVYPLDGGQILRGLLWLKVGPIRSLKIASIIGFGGAILFALWAIASRSIWLGILAFFIFAQAQAGWRAAQNLAIESEDAARREAAISPPPIPERQL